MRKRLHCRVILILYAVGLLWCTNLALVFYAVNDVALYRPTMFEVADVVYNAFEAVAKEKDSYDSCAAMDLKVCTDTYEIDHAAEQTRVSDIEGDNRAKIDTNKGLRVAALQQINASMTILEGLVTTGALLLSDYQVNTSQNCPKLERWITGQLRASDAMNLFDQFTANTTTLIASRAEQLEARRRYDEEYIANKTIEMQKLKEEFKEAVQNPDAAMATVQRELDELKACFMESGTFGNATCSSPEGSVVRNTQDTLDRFQTKFDDYETAFTTYFNDVTVAIDVVRDFLGYIDQINTNLRNLGLGTIAMSDPGPSGTAAQPVFVSIGGVTITSVDPNGTLAFLGIVETALAQRRQGLNQGAGEAAATSDDLLDEFWQDYAPPNISTDESKAAWEEEKKRQRALLDTILDEFSTPDETKEDNFGEPVRVETLLPESPDELINDTPLRAFDLFLYPESIFQSFALNIQQFVDLLIMFDVVFRVVHTLFIIRKYWLLSTIGKPPGDARIHRVAGGKFGIHETFDQKVARLVTHPFVLVGVAFIFVGLIAATFWLVYEPLYNQYVDTCVKTSRLEFIAGTNEGNGTMLYRNGLSIASNFAFANGDNIIQEDGSKLNARRDSDCRRESFDTTRDYNNDAALNYAILQDYANSLSLNEELRTCLDIGAIDSAFSTAFVAETTSGVWELEFENMTSAIYNCSKISPCEIGCAGPSNDVVTRDVYTGACVAEWWIHGSLMGSVMTVVMFVLINIARIELVNATVKAWWRLLAPAEFSYYGSCERDGTLIYPESTSEEGMYLQEVVKKAVHLRIASWEKGAYIHMLYALTLNVPWIFLLVVLSRDLTFTQSLN